MTSKEAFDNLKGYLYDDLYEYQRMNEELETIEKTVDALMIIKNFRVCIDYFMVAETLDDYNYYAKKWIGSKFALDQEDFDLLKEVLE